MFSAAGKTAAAVSTAANYIEDVFSTWLYTGNGSTQTITNGIDLSTKGGLVWLKQRDGTWGNYVTDTARGAGNSLLTNSTSAQSATDTSRLSAFNTNGFSIGNSATVNGSGSTMASWTFRKQPKFFDVVTYTGNGTTGQSISHNLGSVPGCIIVKRTSGVGDWFVWHRGLTSTSYGILLDTTDAQFTNAGFLTATPTSTAFSLKPPGFDSDGVNGSGSTYVAYIFAHDAGGFGLTGTDNVISCGGGTFDGDGYAVVNLGYEPQWVLIKPTTYADNWYLADTMRGATALLTSGTNSTSLLYPNLSNAETSTSYGVVPNATGFTYLNGSSGQGYIYIAIRRGPMKTPTSGTSVFTTNTYTGTGAARTITTGFVTDLVFGHGRTNDISGTAVADRLRGDTKYLETTSTAAETTSDGTSQDITGFDLQTGYTLGVPNNSWMNNNGSPGVNWAWRRAPGFFDVVCYAGTGSARTINHNLGVVPELIITKMRSSTRDWGTGWASLGWTARGPALNSTETSFTTSLWWNNTAPTSTVFTVGTSPTTNGSGSTYVAYLFASCPGVSKVGSYTGTGTTLQIDCGFTGGARFVLIKRTDSTGDWYVWDSARGIVSGNDPYLLLNSTAAEVTNTDYVDTYSAGFEISSTAPAAINANGGTFIFLAIA